MRSGFLEGFREMKMEIGGLVWWGCGRGRAKRRGKREVELRKERKGGGDGARSGRFILISSE